MDPVGLGVAAAVLVLGLAIGVWWRSTGGRLRAARPDTGAGDPDRIEPALLTALGAEPAAATLLQFSSAFCAPCRAVRRVSADVAALLPGVRHVEVDAEAHMDAVRALNVWRTPTLFVLDAGGRIVQRATGVPTKPQLIAALAGVLPARESAPDRR
ncbi:MAG TPA: thioredoxin family protein [Actinoplanes sp.]|jgi:thiol-disulfide isomerase/thioredoxin